MYKKSFVCLLLCTLVWRVFFNDAFGQSKDIPAELYKASTIPDSLKKDANAVVRYSMTDIVVKGPGREVIREHTLVTILNEKAKSEAEIELWYDKKFISVNAAEMLVYDADGKLIKKYHKGDMYDRAAGHDGMTVITDDRVVGTEHTIVSYPVTIEQITEINSNSFLDLGEWQIQHPDIAVQNSFYHAMVNPAVGFRYKNKHTIIKPVVAKGEMDSYTWEVKNLRAIKLEDNALDWQVFPGIFFATSSFEYGGIPGDLSSWKGYGKWQLGLNADVNSLSPAREEEIRQMVANLKTDKEKVKFLYEYLQHNVRYVSIQLGIGGFKPFPASFVDQKKYGDCKALANYMFALLKAVNIPSYYAIVRAGENEEPADPGFPNDPFNHIILCVPLKGDTTWLECTSAQQPFGKLGTFTENRNALLVTEDGGKLVNTPKSTMDDNRFKSEVHLVLDGDGGAKAKMQLWITGGYRDEFLGLDHEKADDQKKMLIQHFGLKQPSALELKPIEDKEGTKEVDVDLEYDRFCDIISGDKLFYKPRVFNLWQLTLPVLETRKSDYYFEHPMQKTCVTTIDLPQGFEVETMPANASLQFSYGNYEVNYVYDTAKNQIVSTAKFNLTRYAIPAAKYNEMQQYMDNIAKVQNKKLVIRKKA